MVGIVKSEVLTSLELFSALDPEEITNLARVCTEKSFDPGATLFLEGQQCAGLWIVAKGSANVVKVTRMGRQVVLLTQSAPCIVAEVPVVDGGPYPASLVAVQPVTALIIDRQEFLALCRRDSNLTLRLLAMFGRRLRHLVGLVEQITFGSIRQRLAQELLSRADQSEGTHFRLEETHEQLAFQLGTVREVVSRNLGRFQSEGFIQMDRPLISILNRPGLEQEAATEF